MNTKLRTEAKNYLEKGFFKLMNNAVFGKTMEKVRSHRDIKLVTTNKRRSYLVSEPKYDKMFFRKRTSNRNEKNKSKNEQASLSRSINTRN